MDMSQKLNTLSEALLSYEPLLRAILDKAEGTVYLVGGALRDALLNKEIPDLDFAVEGSVAQLGKDLARDLNGTFVSLDPQRDEGKLILKGGPEVDLCGLGRKPVEEDLGRRDFTINAMAVPLVDLFRREYSLMDPFGGLEDCLSGKIRALTEASFRQDPIRILRALRFSAQLNFSVEEKTLNWMKRDAHLLSRCAGERIWNELRPTSDSPKSFAQMELAAQTGVLETLFPELRDTRSVGQAKGPIQNLFQHSLLTYACAEEIIANLEETPFGQVRLDAEGYLLERRALLKLSALLHDIGKPQALAEDSSGVIHFYGHERIGARKAKLISKERLKLSRKETKTLTTLIALHMRPHLLAREGELSPRAMRRFFRDCEDEGIGVLLLAYADALASREGEGANLERTTSQLLSFYLEQKTKPRLERLLTGDDLIDELKLDPSPLFKVILKEVEERQLEGEIETREEALTLARKLAQEQST